MELSSILAAAYDETGNSSTPPTGITTRFTRFINEGVRVILGEPGLARLQDSDLPFTFASVASTARYVTTESVARIVAITERTNDYRLSLMSLDTYRRIEPDPASNSGTPTHFVPIGKVALATQLADASAVFVKSTSASDGAGVTAYVEGIITGGYLASSSVAMNGATAVQLPNISSFIDITDFYISAAANGTVTLTEDSGIGTELARISATSKRPRYYGFYLWPTPASAITYYVDSRRETVELVNATDEPPLPTDFHPMLVAYVVWREYERLQDVERSAPAKARYDKFMKGLRYFVSTMNDELPVLGRGRLVGRSRLGGFFPADYWVRG